MGALLGTSDAQGKIIEISNSFPIQLRVQKSEESSKDPEYIFDTEYLKKMLKFHKQVNEMENILGVYISTDQIQAQEMAIVKYFLDLFTEKSFFRSPLKSPIIMLFDPTLKNNKLSIKVSPTAPLTVLRLDLEHLFVLLQRMPNFQRDAV